MKTPGEKLTANATGDKMAAMELDHYRSRRVFWTLFMAAFCSNLGIGIIVPFLPQYAQQVGAVKLFYVGVIFGFMNLSRLIFLPIMRREAESGRRSKKTILIEGLGFYVLLSISYIWADNALSLGIVRFFNGFAAAMVIPISMAIVGELAPVMGEGREMGDFQMSLLAGFGLGPLLGGVLDDIAGFGAAFASMGALNLIAMILVIVALPSYDSSELAKEKKIRTPPSYRKALSSRVVMGVLVFRFINFVGRGASFTFIPIMATDPKYLSLSNTEIGLIITCIALLAGALGPIFGRMADRMSRVKLVIVGSLGFAWCIAMMPHCRSFSTLLATGALSGVFGAVALPASAAISVVEGRKFGMVTIMTLFEMATSLGMFFGPPVGGLVGDKYGLAWAFYFSGILSLVGTIVFYLLVRHTDADKPLAPGL